MTPRIVLAGGGHSHVLALPPLARRLGADARITLISPQTTTPYSGMLPGCVAGDYRRERCFINLQTLAGRAGVEFLQDEVAAVDTDVGVVETAAGARLRFDLFSANTGSTPPLSSSASSSGDVAAVKPMGKFLDWFFAWRDSPAVRDIAIVGAGAGGVELALALAGRRRGWRITLLDAAGEIAPAFPPAARTRLRRLLEERGVCLALGKPAHFAGGKLLRDGAALPADKTIIAAGAAAPPWAADSGLALDAGGFVRVNKFLQSVSHARVFVSGDAAAHPSPLPKAGVFAVRQGKPLAINLAAAARGGVFSREGVFSKDGGFCEWRDSPRALAILSVGAKRAVAVYGDWCAAGRWVWRWKHFLDARFMRRFA